MSTNLCIFEDKKFSNFLPLSLSQPVFDLRVGCGTLRSRLVDALPRHRLSLVCRDYLADVVRIVSSPASVNEAPTGTTLFVNGRLLCFGDEWARLLKQLDDDTIAVKGGYVVAARLTRAAAVDLAAYLRKRVSDEAVEQMCAALRARSGTVAELPRRRKASARASNPAQGTYEDVHAIGQDDVEEKLPLELEGVLDARSIRRVEWPEARLVSFPWQLIEFNSAAIVDDFARLPFRGQAEDCVVYPGVHVVDAENVVIGEKAVIRAGVVLDASGGAIVIGDRVVVMPNATIVGPASIGPDTIVKTGAKILEGTSIGAVCKVGGEVEETILGAYSNKQHDGFIGNSYLGEWVNIGAASNNSDLKNNYSLVRMWCAGSIRETGRQFLGLLMGDHTKTGINTLFNTGTVVGFNCNIFSSEMPAKFVPSFSWGHGEHMTRYDIDKAMNTASVVMERRHVKFTAAHQQLFRRIHELSEHAAGNL